MPTPGSTRKTQVVRAAAELWAATGYHGTGVEELSHAVGLQRGALYPHIGSQEALLHEVGRNAIQRLLASRAQQPARSIGPKSASAGSAAAS